MYICTAGSLSVSLINDTVSTSWYGNTLYLLITERMSVHHILILYTVYTNRSDGEHWELLYKLLKNTILIGISSNFLHNISTCICIRKNYKNGDFFPCHF